MIPPLDDWANYATTYFRWSMAKLQGSCHDPPGNTVIIRWGGGRTVNKTARVLSELFVTKAKSGPRQKKNKKKRLAFRGNCVKDTDEIA